MFPFTDQQNVKGLEMTDLHSRRGGSLGGRVVLLVLLDHLDSVGVLLLLDVPLHVGHELVQLKAKVQCG